MKLVLYLSLGGVAGTLARYFLGTWLQPPTSSFPWGTLAINVAGSFVLGFLMRYLPAGAAPELRAGLTIGFCGAFTTMSTFSYETVALMQGGQLARAALYVAGSTGGSVVGAWAGLIAGSRLA